MEQTTEEKKREKLINGKAVEKSQGNFDFFEKIWVRKELIKLCVREKNIFYHFRSIFKLEKWELLLTISSK
jgi:hypothetical protein